MPSINDIVQVAEALEKSPIAVLRDRCVAVRNRNATCRLCVQACHVDAIDVSANEIHLSASACVGCGVCASVCPTEALVPVNPSDADLVAAAEKSGAANDGRVVLACARMASKHVADPNRFAEVSCLGRVEESLIVHLASRGAADVLLVDGVCATCKYGFVSPHVDEAISEANALMAAHGSDVRASRASQFPEELLVDSAEGMFGSTRRGFFAEAAGAAKETAMTAAKTSMAQELGFLGNEASIGERLRVTESGTMPRLDMPRHDALINAMDALGEQVVSTIDSRRFGRVSLDADKCNACGMCAVFCPTGAIKRADEDNPAALLECLEFSAADCVNCGLCADVCWKGALTLSREVSTEQLFDFEPVAFDLSRAPKPTNNPFGKAGSFSR